MKPYADRKNLKPIDFFLSVHNADLMKMGNNLKYLYPLEREIDEKYFSQAAINHQTPTTQLNYSVTELFQSGVVGLLKGHDKIRVYLADSLAYYDKMMSVSFFAEQKWFDI